MRTIYSSVMLAGVLLLGACAAPPKQAFNRDAAAHIREVVVARAHDETEYEAAVLGHPGMSFGLIGGLVAAADMQAKSGKLTAALVPKETRLSQRLGEQLSAGLVQDGYITSVIELPENAKEDQVLDFVRAKKSVDAVVSIRMFAGYWAAGPTTDYFPRLMVKVKTYDVKSRSVIYEDTITYGYAAQQSKTIHLASDGRFRFKDMDALVTNVPLAREGLFQGVDAIAGQISADLKKQ